MDNIYSRRQQKQDGLLEQEQIFSDGFSGNEEESMNDGSSLSQNWGQGRGFEDSDFRETDEDDDRRDSDYVDPYCNGDEPAEVVELLRRIEEGEIPLNDAQQKGNYGEMKMDEYFDKQGYQDICFVSNKMEIEVPMN